MTENYYCDTNVLNCKLFSRRITTYFNKHKDCYVVRIEKNIEKNIEQDIKLEKELLQYIKNATNKFSDSNYTMVDNSYMLSEYIFKAHTNFKVNCHEKKISLNDINKSQNMNIMFSVRCGVYKSDKQQKLFVTMYLVSMTIIPDTYTNRTILVKDYGISKDKIANDIMKIVNNK
jgi:uncharacterized membrane protein